MGMVVLSELNSLVRVNPHSDVLNLSLVNGHLSHLVCHLANCIMTRLSYNAINRRTWNWLINVGMWSIQNDLIEHLRLGIHQVQLLGLKDDFFFSYSS